MTGWVALDELAAVVGLSVRSLQQLAATAPGSLVGLQQQDGAVRFDLVASARALRRLAVERSEAAAPPVLDFEAARTRKMTAEAELAEMNVAESRGQLVTVGDYEAALGRILDREMARLRALPVRLSHLGAAVEDAAEIEVENMIVEMSRYDEDVIDEPDHPPRSQT